MPSPAPKTKIVAIEARKQDGKGKADSVGAVAAGRQKPSPVPKPKTPALDVRKQDGKGKTDPAGPGEDGKAVARPGRQAASARKS